MKLITDFSAVNVIIGAVLAVVLFVMAVFLPLVFGNEKNFVRVYAKKVGWIVGFILLLMSFAWLLDANWWFDYMISYTLVTACLLFGVGIVKLFQKSIAAARNSHKLGFYAGVSALNSVNAMLVAQNIARNNGYFFDNDDDDCPILTARVWYSVLNVLVLAVAILSFNYNFAVVEYQGNTIVSSKYGAAYVSGRHFVALQVDNTGTYVYSEVSEENSSLYNYALEKLDPSRQIRPLRGDYSIILSNGTRCENSIKNIQNRSENGRGYLKAAIEKQFSNGSLSEGRWEDIALK